jgi:hypothetical protein
MLAELSPQFSLVSTAILIFLLCIAFVILRGILRMLVTTAVLTTCAWIAWNVWIQAPALCIECFGKPLSWFTWGLPGTAFLLSWLIIRTIIKTITSPFSHSQAPAPRKPLSLPRLAFFSLLAIIPASALWIIGATLIHHFGSVAELAEFSSPKPIPSRSKLARHSRELKQPIAKALPESWIAKIDPLSAPSRMKLAKWISSQSQQSPVSSIDPATGKPATKSGVINDPQLQILARDGKFDSLLRHPLLTKALADPNVQSLLNRADP